MIDLGRFCFYCRFTVFGMAKPNIEILLTAEKKHFKHNFSLWTPMSTQPTIFDLCVMSWKTYKTTSQKETLKD